MIYDMQKQLEQLRKEYPNDKQIAAISYSIDHIVDGITYGGPHICIDFDGTIHSYEQGWTGVDDCPGKPIPGAIEFIREALGLGVRVSIFSARCNHVKGIWAMQEWFVKHGLEAGDLRFQPGKPPFTVLIDDHNIAFSGSWKLIRAEDCVRFKGWTRVSGTFATVKNIIVERWQIDPQAITLTSKFEDLGNFDSLDLVELVMALEEEFDVLFSDDEDRDWTSIKDIVESIEAL